jgi:hypothetical protein
VVVPGAAAVRPRGQRRRFDPGAAVEVGSRGPRWVQGETMTCSATDKLSGYDKRTMPKHA